MAQVIEKIVRSKYPPRDTRVIWLDEETNAFKAFRNSGWQLTLPKDKDNSEYRDKNSILYNLDKFREENKRPDISNAIDITFKEFRKKIINNNLKPNSLYRIIDYTPSINDKFCDYFTINILSPGFDIIVRTNKDGIYENIAWAANKKKEKNFEVLLLENKPYAAVLQAINKKNNEYHYISAVKGRFISSTKLDVNDKIFNDKISKKVNIKISDLVITDNSIYLNTHESAVFKTTNFNIKGEIAILLSSHFNDLKESDDIRFIISEKEKRVYKIKNESDVYIYEIIESHKSSYFNEEDIEKWILKFSISESRYNNIYSEAKTLYKWRKYELQNGGGELVRTNNFILTEDKDIQASFDNPYNIAGCILETQDEVSYEKGKSIVYFDKENMRIYEPLYGDIESKELEIEYCEYDGEITFKDSDFRGCVIALLDENNILSNIDFKNILIYSSGYRNVISINYSAFDTSVFYSKVKIVDNSILLFNYINTQLFFIKFIFNSHNIIINSESTNIVNAFININNIPNTVDEKFSNINFITLYDCNDYKIINCSGFCSNGNRNYIKNSILPSNVGFIDSFILNSNIHSDSSNIKYINHNIQNSKVIFNKGYIKDIRINNSDITIISNASTYTGNISFDSIHNESIEITKYYNDEAVCIYDPYDRKYLIDTPTILLQKLYLRQNV